MNDIQTLELVDRRWNDLLKGQKLDTIRFNEGTIVPGLLRYLNCDDSSKTCIVYVTNVQSIPLHDVLKYSKDLERKPDEGALLSLMREHYPAITLDTVVDYIQHLSPEETTLRFSKR